MVAAGTPAPIVKRLAAAVDRGMQGSDMRERLAAAGIEPDYRRSDEFQCYLKEQKARFTEIIRKGNIKIE